MRRDKITQALNSPTTRLVYSRDKSHKVYFIESIRTSKPYQVILDWTSQDSIPTLKAELFSYDIKEMPHPANSSKYLCYQCLAAAKKMAKEAGKILSLCKSKKAALNLLRLGGQIIKIVNPAGSIVWATVR